MAIRDPLQPAVPRHQLSFPEPAPPAPSADLAQAIGHVFARPELLAEAVAHPSALGLGRGRRGYQRLEWLGDRVLGLVIADLLWHRFASESEGHLTRRLTHLVRREALARVAEELDLGRYAVLSPAEAQAGAARSPAILADMCEAVIGAVYVDGGLPAAAELVRRLWQGLLADMTAPPRDPKTLLQEWAQARGLPLPDYALVDTSGPDHALRFTVAANLPGFAPATATASSKRQAETQAAARLLETVAESGREPLRRRRK
jgi:ribonuclease III